MDIWFYGKHDDILSLKMKIVAIVIILVRSY